VGEVKSGFALKRNIQISEIFNFCFYIQVMSEKFRLPEIPGSNEAFTTRLQVILNLFEHKELVVTVVQVVNDGYTKNIVKWGEIFPGIRFGNVCF